jgi:iron complex outermembrane receptor protein
MKSYYGVSFAAALTLGIGHAVAQENTEIEEIVVTATKVEKTLQDIPIAVTVTSADTLQKAFIQDVADLASVVPSLRVTTLQTSTQTNFVIRGFGNGANNPGIEPSVGVFIDGVYRSRSASQIGDLVDVQRVEVLRGPQSTLFGQNASVGVISVTTQKPSFQFGGTAEASYGNYNEMLFKGRVTGPLAENVAFSVAGSVNKRDGYFSDLANNVKINDHDRWDLRGQLLWNASDNLSVRLIADTSKISEHCCGVVNLVNGPTGAIVTAVGGKIYTGDRFDRAAYYNTIPINDVKNSGGSLHVDYKMGAFTLTSITALRHQDAAFNYDADFTSANLVPTNQNDQRIDTRTEELRLAYDDGGKLQALAGAYYFNERVKYDNTIQYGNAFRPYATGIVQGAGGSPSTFNQLEGALGLPTGTFFTPGTGNAIFTKQTNDAYTLFGQVDYKVIDRLTATGGLAYTNTKKDIRYEQKTTDVFSSLNLVQLGFGQIFQGLTGLPATPANFARVPTAAAAADSLSVRPCSATTGAACNPLLALYPLQFLSPVVPFTGNSDDSKVTYTARLAYEIDDNMRAYAGVSTGFKATSWNLSRDSKPVAPATPDRSPLGGAVNPYYGQYGSRKAGPEESSVYEVGFKARWSQVAVNVAVFDQIIKNFQSNIFVGTGFVLGNAGKQSTRGVEIETQFKLDRHWKFDVSGTFLDPKYDSYPGAQGPNGPVDLSGTKPAGIPTTALSLGGTYSWNMGNVDGFVRADYHYESESQAVDNVSAAIASRKVSTLNASAGVSYNTWDLMIWGRNLNDDSYLLSAFPSVAQTGSFSGYPNQPRTFGATVRKSF